MEDGWGSPMRSQGHDAGNGCLNPGSTLLWRTIFISFAFRNFYLMKAEALVRRDGGSNGEATTLVNAIRERAFPGMPSKLYSSVTLDDIMMERRFELAWEGYARQDKIRFGHFADPIPGWKDYTDPIDLND